MLRPTQSHVTVDVIDGKTYRGSHDHSKGLGRLHIVSAWASGQGISLGQFATNGKCNEITAIPKLLERVDLQEVIVTINAMHWTLDVAFRQDSQ